MKNSIFEVLDWKTQLFLVQTHFSWKIGLLFANVCVLFSKYCIFIFQYRISFKFEERKLIIFANKFLTIWGIHSNNKNNSLRIVPASNQSTLRPILSKTSALTFIMFRFLTILNQFGSTFRAFNSLKRWKFSEIIPIRWKIKTIIGAKFTRI